MNPTYLTIEEFSDLLLKAVLAERSEAEITRRQHPEDVGFLFEIACASVTATLVGLTDLRREEFRNDAG